MCGSHMLTARELVAAAHICQLALNWCAMSLTDWMLFRGLFDVPAITLWDRERKWDTPERPIQEQSYQSHVSRMILQMHQSARPIHETDPRDHIYALAGLFGPQAQESQQP